tara:strand:+ start:18732 stop:19736 length:1005 start_codon:yes stop_codon:yes gene_type:complete
MKIYVHIGAGKCGSSSIQNFFSYNNQFSTKKAYCAIGTSGEVFTGENISNLAKSNVYDYLSSANLSLFKDDSDAKDKLKSSLQSLSLKYDAILLSNEGWLEQSNLFEDLDDVFSNYEVQVLLVVRPPVEWLNSGWWQWGQWSGVELEQWLFASLSKTRWFDYYTKWDSLNSVKKVTTIALNGDVLTEFADIIGFNYSAPKGKTNISSDSKLLRLFKERRSLRPSPHEPQVEFSLNRHITSKGKPDWVISRSNIAKILRETEESNLNLLSTLHDRSVVENDSRWWGRGYYKNIDESIMIDKPLNKDELYDMLESAYHAIHKLDMELRKFSNNTYK